MSLLNQVFQGNPNALGATAAGGSTLAPNVAVDSVNGALYLSTGNGWVPFSDALAKSVLTNQTAATIPSVLTYTAPVTGIYRITTYAVQTVAGTGVVLGATNVSYTEGDTGVAQTNSQIQGSDTVSAVGAHNSGSVIINALAGTPIVISSGLVTPSTATYDIKARIEFLG